MGVARHYIRTTRKNRRLDFFHESLLTSLLNRQVSAQRLSRPLEIYSSNILPDPDWVHMITDKPPSHDQTSVKVGDANDAIINA